MLLCDWFTSLFESVARWVEKEVFPRRELALEHKVAAVARTVDFLSVEFGKHALLTGECRLAALFVRFLIGFHRLLFW